MLSNQSAIVSYAAVNVNPVPPWSGRQVIAKNNEFLKNHIFLFKAHQEYFELNPLFYERGDAVIPFLKFCSCSYFHV
jgi:hypothetical protein